MNRIIYLLIIPVLFIQFSCSSDHPGILLPMENVFFQQGETFFEMEPVTMVIRDQQSWDSLMGEGTIDFDFSTSMIILIILGDRSNQQYSLTIDEVRLVEKDVVNEIVIYYTEHVPSRGSIVQPALKFLYKVVSVPLHYGNDIFIGK